MQLRWYQSEAVDAMLAAKDNSVVVLPTGSGKTFVMRSFVEQFPGRVLLLSHVKEILSQNFDTLASLGEVGLYSAGLGVKHIDRITIAGIHSVYMPQVSRPMASHVRNNGRWIHRKLRLQFL